MRITQQTVRTAKPKEKIYEIRDSSIPGFILRVYPSGAKSFVIEYARGRRVTLGRTSIKTLTQAQTEAIQIANDYANGNEIRTPRKKTQPFDGHTSLEDFLTGHYQDYCNLNHARPREAIGRIRSCFKDLLNKKLEQITRLQVENIRDQRLKEGYKPATIARDVATIKGVLSEAVRLEILTRNPLSGIKPPKLDKLPVVRYLSDDEETRLMRVLSDREKLRAMVLVSMNTGIRFGELTALTWTDISLKHGTLTVHGQNAKSGQTRHIPLNRIAVDTLRDWQKSGNGKYVFPGKNGRRLDNVRKSWLTALKTAEIKNFRWHDLRHTFASRLVMGGVDLNTVRELMGHGTIAMTLRYAHLAPNHKAQAVETLVTK